MSAAPASAPVPCVNNVVVDDGYKHPRNPKMKKSCLNSRMGHKGYGDGGGVAPTYGPDPVEKWSQFERVSNHYHCFSKLLGNWRGRRRCSSWEHTRDLWPFSIVPTCVVPQILSDTPDFLFRPACFVVPSFCALPAVETDHTETHCIYLRTWLHQVQPAPRIHPIRVVF